MTESREMSIEDLSPETEDQNSAAPPAAVDGGKSTESVNLEGGGGGSTGRFHSQTSRVGISPQGSRVSNALRPQTARSSGSYQQFGARGGKFSGASPKTDVDWATYKAKQSPGPGEYKIDNAYRVSGGKFNLSKPKTDVDWNILNARRQPGPGDYNIGAHEKLNGGRFSSARPMSALDWTVHHARNSPGPGQYDADPKIRLRGGKFSTAKPKSDVDWHMYHSKQSPGPGQYGINRDFHLPGGKFNMSQPKTDVDWSILRASQSPGPLDYDIDASYHVSGGKFSSSRPKSALEWAMHKGKQQPGPGEYNIELSSISRRTGVVGNQPSNPSLPKEFRPKSAPGIPPEARRKPKPKPPDFYKQHVERKPKRPASTGIPPEARRTPNRRATSAPPGPRNPLKTPSPAISSANQVTVQVNGVESPTRPSSTGMQEPKGDRKGGVGMRPSTASNLYNKRDPAFAPPARPASSFPGHTRAPRTKSISVQASEEEIDVRPPIRPQTAHPRASARPNYVQRRPPPVTTTTPVRASKRIPKGRRSANLQGRDGSSAMSETRSQLSDNARKLFDLAMQSTEFKKMMELYTGVKDPSSIIEKYAIMWSYQPLLNDSGRRR